MGRKLGERHAHGDVRLGGDMISDAKRGAPLRKIVGIIRHGEGMFDRDRVELECGHETSSNATYRARCAACKKSTDEQRAKEAGL